MPYVSFISAQGCRGLAAAAGLVTPRVFRVPALTTTSEAHVAPDLVHVAPPDGHPRRLRLWFNKGKSGALPSIRSQGPTYRIGVGDAHTVAA